LEAASHRLIRAVCWRIGNCGLAIGHFHRAGDHLLHLALDIRVAYLFAEMFNDDSAKSY
jgi:hypothetical protein